MGLGEARRLAEWGHTGCQVPARHLPLPESARPIPEKRRGPPGTLWSSAAPAVQGLRAARLRSGSARISIV